MPSDSYPYAVGRIRGLEKSLLGTADFNRLEDLPTDAAIKSLADSGYGAAADNKRDPDSLIDAEMESVRELMDEVTPNKELTDLFLIDNDAINIKLMFKARLLGDELSDSDFAYGLIDVDTLKEAVDEKDYRGFPDGLGEGLEKVEEMIDEDERLGKKADPLLVSSEIDKAVYGYMFQRLKKLRNKFVAKYFCAKVDFTNLLGLLRARALGWDKGKYEKLIIDGGELKTKDLLDVYDLPADMIDGKLPTASLYYEVKRGLAAYVSEGSSVPAAAASFDRSLMDIAGEERYDPFGIGPIVYFLLRKMDESKKLRVLFAKKRSKDSREGAR